MQRQPLVIAVAQPRITPYDIVSNAAVHADTVRAAHARVVVFPELSLTGYELDAPAITTDDPRLTPIVKACADRGTTALVGAPVQGEAGREHIAMLAIDSVGPRVAYRKVHVHESEERFSPGDGPAVLEVDGWRLGLAICRETRFAEHDAATAALGMDVYVAAVVDHARDAHVSAERAQRVIADRGVWVATASFAGPTGGGFDQTAGGSAIWAPDGGILAQAGPEPGKIVRATLRDYA
ncbi:carbon-nitrogen hydrolase family protein [Micromonospora sp. KC721]|uniref:carbon-nitrogen hydrolase family protein n=1 Tax=Micromonospora sp. KC721 TaxID=2530380 RepID=UPI00104A09DB|nr:carbon-nitrogen hydrolase family protein [Micromonospora sp. KC721]TDB81958.1 carbon-nitrogen hydrolase family protein [Micromonospora sp. KC721]